METLTISGKVKANGVLTVINTRRAVREYTSKPVDMQLIETLLDAGRMAPSAINKQPWKFYVVTNKQTINRFSKEIEKVAETHFNLSHGTAAAKVENAIFHGAPVVIFITAPKNNDWAQLDIGMCAENIMLAAKSLGLDSCPVGLGKFIEMTSCYAELKVPATDHVLLSVILGYGNENPEVHPRKTNNVFYIK